MLGETRKNNDVYIFFQDDEVERLKDNEIQGIYFNFQDVSRTCTLRASLDNNIIKEIDTLGEINQEGFFTEFKVKLNQEKYKTLKERGTCGVNEGFRHIELFDASHPNNLSFQDKFAYNQLRHYKSKYCR
jgi:hypothetical protein